MIEGKLPPIEPLQERRPEKGCHLCPIPHIQCKTCPSPPTHPMMGRRVTLWKREELRSALLSKWWKVILTPEGMVQPPPSTLPPRCLPKSQKRGGLVCQASDREGSILRKTLIIEWAWRREKPGQATAKGFLRKPLVSFGMLGLKTVGVDLGNA